MAEVRLARIFHENATASAFPVACCGVSERTTIKWNLFLTFRIRLRRTAACCRELQISVLFVGSFLFRNGNALMRGGQPTCPVYFILWRPRFSPHSGIFEGRGQRKLALLEVGEFLKVLCYWEGDLVYFIFWISKLGTRPQGGESEGQYRTRNLEQQKFLKGIIQCFSLQYSAVSCSAVLRFIFSTTW